MSLNGDGLMTVGDLAQRTGLSHKAIRDLEGRGLIYTAGRSESNYRLFTEDALWCVDAIGELRSLGLTLSEIEQLHAVHLDHPELASGLRLAQALERAEARIRARMAAEQQTLERIAAYRARNRDALSGRAGDPFANDPCGPVSRRRT